MLTVSNPGTTNFCVVRSQLIARTPEAKECLAKSTNLEPTMDKIGIILDEILYTNEILTWENPALQEIVSGLSELEKEAVKVLLLF